MLETKRRDAELIDKAQKGDHSSFGELVQLHKDYVYNLAFHLTAGNRAEADDLAQATFVRAFRAIGRFQGRSEFRTWLHRITVNLWKNMVRSQIRRKYFKHQSINGVLNQEDKGAARELEEKRPDPLHAAAQNEMDRLIRQAIAQLPPDEREVTILRDIQGYAYGDIAKICKIPLGTVKSRISRARRLLRNVLEPLVRS